MSFVQSLSLLAAGSLLSLSPLASALQPRSVSYTDVCGEIASSISSASEVFYPLSIEYIADNEHWASSSSQDSACSIEPGTAEDVGIVLQIVANYSTPFAVKGGGHTANAGYSSTEGIHIAMSRFSGVDYDSSSNTATVGAGLIWDDVYEALADYGVNVVGGRVTGVGVAGFTLGGGYSWLTNQHGLTIDTVTAFELVLPNGTVATVTSDDEDLFFALKGGWNNFGIVTKFTLQTFSQSDVWGGLRTYTGDKLEALAEATANFAQNNTDAKAALISEFNTLLEIPIATVNFFYDAPEEPPAGVFDELLAVTPLTDDLKVRTFVDLVTSTPSNATSFARGVFHTVTVANFTKDIIDVILDELNTVGESLGTTLMSGAFISYDVEPFLPGLFSFGDEDSSAYPPSRSTPFYPLNIYYAWVLSVYDLSFQSIITESAARIQAAAVSQGQDVSDPALYGNYAIAGTSLESIYGESHLTKLQQIKKEVDPDNVMALAGGWKITPAS